MLIASIFLNILSNFYCAHKLPRIKSAGNMARGEVSDAESCHKRREYFFIKLLDCRFQLLTRGTAKISYL